MTDAQNMERTRQYIEKVGGVRNARVLLEILKVAQLPPKRPTIEINVRVR